MKFIISFFIACTIFLAPFFYGYCVGRDAYGTIVSYQNKDLTEEQAKKMEESIRIHEQVTNITKKEMGNLIKFRQQYPEETLPLFVYVLMGNLKKILLSLLAVGISFIPISYRSGMWIGYNLEIGLSWWTVIMMEFLSYVLFGSLIYYLLLNLFTLKRKNKKSFILKSSLIFLAAFIILTVAAYLEVILIQVEI